MKKRILFVFLALVLMLATAQAELLPPESIGASFVGYSSVKISWEHAGGEDVYYKIYRGEDVEDASVIGTTDELFYLDDSIVGGANYVYFITAADLNTESSALYSLSVKPTQKPERPFTIELIFPIETIFGFEEELDFIVGIESRFLNELEGLNVVMVDTETGAETLFSYDLQKKVYILSRTMPAANGAETGSVSYKVKATAYVAEELFTETETFELTLVQGRTQPGGPPIEQIIGTILSLVLPPLIFLLFAGAIVFAVKKFLKKKEEEHDLLELQLVDVLKERAVWKHDMLNNFASKEQYAEKEHELQLKQENLEDLLGLKKKGIEISKNPFAGFDRDQMEEIGKLVKAMGPQKRELSQKAMLKWIVGRGSSERVAKKVVQLIYENKYI